MKKLVLLGLILILICSCTPNYPTYYQVEYSITGAATNVNVIYTSDTSTNSSPENESITVPTLPWAMTTTIKGGQPIALTVATFSNTGFYTVVIYVNGTLVDSGYGAGGGIAQASTWLQ